MSQRLRIIEHLRDCGSITDLEAYSEFGIRRLGARIWDLRRDGYDIETEMVEGHNRFGEVTRYAKYTLKRGENNGESDSVPILPGFGQNPGTRIDGCGV